jgi:hypothetical protein
VRYSANRIRYKRVVGGYDLVYDGCSIARITKETSLARPWSKSNMCTRHSEVWRATVEGVEGLDSADRLRLRRELKRRDKKTRRSVAEYVLASYELVQVGLPRAD